jgi:hypothetical protein
MLILQISNFFLQIFVRMHVLEIICSKIHKKIRKYEHNDKKLRINSKKNLCAVFNNWKWLQQVP